MDIEIETKKVKFTEKDQELIMAAVRVEVAKALSSVFKQKLDDIREYMAQLERAKKGMKK